MPASPLHLHLSFWHFFLSESELTRYRFRYWPEEPCRATVLAQTRGRQRAWQI